MNPLTTCACMYCDSIITGRQYCPLHIVPIEWVVILLTAAFIIYRFKEIVRLLKKIYPR